MSPKINLDRVEEIRKANAKFEVTDIEKDMPYWRGKFTVRRIRALRSIITPAGYEVARAGDLGGWVASEDNLSQEDSCWITDEAVVYEGAKVSQNAQVGGYARVYGTASVTGSASVYGSAIVRENALIKDEAAVFGEATVGYRAEIYESAHVSGNSRVDGDAKVGGLSIVRGGIVAGEASVTGTAIIEGSAFVGGNAIVTDYAHISGCGCVVRDGTIKTPRDIIAVLTAGSRDATVTYNKTTGTVCTGCFTGTFDRFCSAVRSTYPWKSDPMRQEYEAFIEYVKAMLSIDYSELKRRFDQDHRRPRV